MEGKWSSYGGWRIWLLKWVVSMVHISRMIHLAHGVDNGGLLRGLAIAYGVHYGGSQVRRYSGATAFFT